MAFIKTRFKWFGPQWLQQFEQHKERRLKEACVFLSNEVKKTLGQKSRPGRRSAPNNPPGLDTGELRRTITWEVKDGVGRVGTNKKYGKFLELGTKKMDPRPFLKTALLANRTAIKKILTRKMD